MPEQSQIGPEQYQAEDHSLTAYLNGFAHVTTSVRFGIRDGIVQVVGIPEQLMLESLHSILGSRDVTIAGARVVEPTTLEELAQGYIGKQVHDLETHGMFTVSAVDGNNLLVRDNGGFYAAPLTSFKFPMDQTITVRQRQALELRLESLKLGSVIDREEETLHLSYLTEGISLIPHYNIGLREDKLTLTAEVGVENKTGKPYDGVELKVVPGEVEKPEVLKRFHSRRAEIMALDAMAVEEVLSAGVHLSEEDGQIVYSFGKKDLPIGQSKFGVFKTQELAYQIVYSTRLGRSERPEISTLLRFETPITLPAGSVAVYSEQPKLGDDKTTVERYEGGGKISNPVLKGKEVNVDLRTPDTLEMKVEQVGEAKVVDTKKGSKEKPIWAIEREYKVTSRNAGQEDVVIETNLGLDKFQSLVWSSLKAGEEREGTRLRWSLSVAAGQSSEFTYKVQEMGFTPMDRVSLLKILGRENQKTPDDYD